MSNQRLKVGSAFLMFGIGCGAPDDFEETDSESTAEADSAIVLGTTDTTENAAFPASVKLGPEGCSGTLVTPYWVMTARHCFDNVGVYAAQEAIIGSTGGTKTVHHTVPTSGPALVWDVSDARDTDLAVFRLDERATPPYAVPAHPPRAPDGCGNFNGKLVGFGAFNYNESGYGPFCNEPGGEAGGRRYSPTATFWTRQSPAPLPGARFQHTFTSAPEQACRDMAGIGIGGDSGGSLYKTATGELCGVISGDGYWNCTGSFSTPLSCDYNTAATDSAGAISFWAQHVLDVDGHWEGETVINAQNDPDGDGIASWDDSCPTVWNPEQLSTFDDPDQNGLGAACDACPGVEADSQYWNRNKEVELAVAYPSALSYPILKRSDFGSDATFLAARDQYLASFVPDACDPYPAPTASIQLGGDLPASVTQPTQNTAGSPCLNYTGGCQLVTKNKIKISPKSSPTVVAAGGSDERIGLRWCDCQLAAGFDDSVAGRARCRTTPGLGCQFSESQYPLSNSKWVKLTTKNGASWTSPSVGAEWTVAAGSAAFSPIWEFNALGPTNVTSTTNYLGVTGMLWTHVDELAKASVPLARANVQKYANALSDGSAHRSFGPNGHLWVAINDWFECPMCDFGVQQVMFENSNPWWFRATPEGRDAIRVVDAPTRSYFDAVAAGTNLHVSASEPVALLNKSYAPTQEYARAIGLSAAGAPVALLNTTGLENVPVVKTFSATGGPTFVGGEGLAFSALGQRLYVLGGVNGAGQPTNTGWFLDIGTSAWRQFSMPSGESVGQVLSMTYRQKDRSVYYLEKGTKLVLRRWNAQRQLSSGVLVTLASFPTSWNAFGKYTVVSGPRGDLGVVAWNGTGTEKTRIGHLKLSAAHRVSLGGLSKLTTPILAAPTLTSDGFAMTILPDSPTASQVSLSSMPTSWGTNAPSIPAH